MKSRVKTKGEQQDYDSLKKTIKVLQSHSPKSKLGKQMQLRHDSIEALYKAHRAFVQKQTELATARASDNPNRITGEAWIDKIMEFEEVEYELACAISDFCYGEIESENDKCWPDLESQCVMNRIGAARDHREAYWTDHPKELAAEQRQSIFRSGKRDAAKELVVK